MSAKEFHIDIDQDGCNVLDALEQASGLSRSEIKQAMEKGAVWLQQGKRVTPLRRSKKLLQAGQQLHFYYNAEVLQKTPLQAELLSQENDYSVWLKPSGMRSYGSRWSDHGSLVRSAEKQLQRDCSIVHRLDQAASGLIMVAHNKAAAAELSRQFAQREIDKSYRIISRGNFPDQAQQVDLELDGKNARSHFQKIDQTELGSLIKVDIETGRKHQVRRHALHLGHPIIGDRLYGMAAADAPNLQLCAYQLRFCYDAKPQHYQVPALEKFLLL